MKFDIPDAHIHIISELLGAAPYSKVAAVVANLQAQINAQQAPAAPLTVPAKPPIVAKPKE
jgi:hypothetical protein